MAVSILVKLLGPTPLAQGEYNNKRASLPPCIIFRSEHESCADLNTSSLPKLVVALRVPFFCFEHFTQKLFKIYEIINK